MVAIAVPMPGTTYRAGSPQAGRRRASSRSPAATSPATFRRRRLAVAVVASGVLVVAWLVAVRLGGGSLSTSEPPSLRVEPVAQVVHVVQPGDTVWAVARAVDPAADPRRTVDRILEARGDGPLQVGERIVLPTTP